jgi:RNA polymerase sigma-70 factor (ECF subfamily)
VTNFSDTAVVLPERRDAGGGIGSAVGERTATRLDEGKLAPLVERARDGELAAFEEIVRYMQGPIRSYARRMMRDPHLGDDAAQETFFRMWKGLPRHEPRGKFVAWTFTVARNTCIEFLRREARTPHPSEEIDAGSVDPYDAADLRRLVNDAIEALGEPYKSAILLRETGMQYEEVAEALDCPVGTVRSRLHEARRQLAEQLRPAIGGDF